jgi:phosphoribosylanthranilate isomerase
MHLGVIFAPKSPRCVEVTAAIEIADSVRRYGERTGPLSLSKEINTLRADRLSPKLWYSRMAAVLEKTTLRRPLVVGVFQDQSVDDINAKVQACGLDLVQLHGHESVEDIGRIAVPCIKVVHVSDADASEDALTKLAARVSHYAGHAIAVIMDTSVRGDKAGGTGVTFDWSIASRVGMPVLLAGGLKPDNAALARQVESVIGLDVSSGVELSGRPGVKDHTLVEAFLRNSA